MKDKDKVKDNRAPGDVQCELLTVSVWGFVWGFVWVTSDVSVHSVSAQRNGEAFHSVSQ